MNLCDYTQVLMLSHVDVAMLFKQKEECIQHVHKYSGCQTILSNTPFVWSQGLNPPYLKSPAKPFHCSCFIPSFSRLQGSQKKKIINLESSFASPNSTFDQNMFSPPLSRSIALKSPCFPDDFHRCSQSLRCQASSEPFSKTAFDC